MSWLGSLLQFFVSHPVALKRSGAQMAALRPNGRVLTTAPKRHRLTGDGTCHTYA